MFRMTPEGRLIEVNAAYARMFGYSSPEEIMNGNLNVLTHSFANSDYITVFQKIVGHSDIVHAFKFPTIKNDGSLV